VSETPSLSAGLSDQTVVVVVVVVDAVVVVVVVVVVCRRCCCCNQTYVITTPTFIVSPSLDIVAFSILSLPPQDVAYPTTALLRNDFNSPHKAICT